MTAPTKPKPNPARLIHPVRRRCHAKNRRGERCQLWTVKGKLVCALHGGKSTGPRTQAGREKCRRAATCHGLYREDHPLHDLAVGHGPLSVDASRRIEEYLTEHAEDCSVGELAMVAKRYTATAMSQKRRHEAAPDTEGITC